MKQTLYTLCVAAAAIATLGACDSIAPDDRYEEMATIDVNKAVLVLDFTGQRCTNCPTAHAIIERMEEQFPEAFIPVSVHAGVQSLSIDNPRYLGLATPLGEELDVQFGIAPHGYPSVVVDYAPDVVFNGTENAWVEATRAAMQRRSVLDLDCAFYHSIDAEGNTVLTVSATALPADDFKCRIQFLILEDGITAPQMGVDGKPGFVEYVHNNVLRASAFDSALGLEVSLPANVYTRIDRQYTLTSDWQKGWVVDNLKVVAFCYTTADGSLQASRAAIEPLPADFVLAEP